MNGPFQMTTREQTMLTVDIPHGGSGEGITGWIKWATGCLIAADLSATNPRPCDNEALLVGTMTHEYLRLWRSDFIAAAERVQFVDTQCGTDIPEEWQDEALRLFAQYSENEDKEKFGPIRAVELRLSGAQVEAALGVSPYTAQIDLLAGRDGNLHLVDYKTSRASGDKRYTSGPGLIQLHAYYFAALAAGYDINKIKIEQLVKTKTPKVNTYDIPLPTIADQRALQKFLGAAQLRRQNGPRSVMLTQCGYCRHKQHGRCIPGA